MRIFISWSGDQSRLFAEELKPWLEQVLPNSDVWLSSEDIDKGTIWFTEIVKELETCNCGVLCVTRENHLSPWIHFEAGGMVKGLGKNRVLSILLDMDFNELGQPLNLFNNLRLNRIGARHLIKSFNRVAEHPIKDRVVERAFEKFWPELDDAYRLLFPDSHEAASRIAQPLIIAPSPAPADKAVSPPELTERRGKKRKQAAESQRRLFNGELE